MTPDWSTFLPDLIVGLFTGLVVGAILAWTQACAARRRERREMSLRWEALRPAIGAQLLDPWDRRVILHSLTEFAERTAKLRDLVKDVPLASWSDVLKSEELRNLHELVKAATELAGAAPKFDAFLRHEIRWRLRVPRDDGRDEYPTDAQVDLAFPIAVRELFAPEPHDRSQAYISDIRSEGPLIRGLVERPPVTYHDVVDMLARAEKHYAASTSIVEAQMTRYWFD